ncbi:VanZ family protein [Lihuaxuella thermophila]|uniref:Glycopeptide antibiotics resistance protein n=1 Tax=Lihuaxuella thermophila TaxID=1173111 RepID=A0A1H8CBW5_9BACL|nr:VanZ family protein [Lihuaxuella thermophila]SEM91738.1 Glycopeptide antibiotics resistance protein [Lihuaxuella thermophila]
MRGIMNKRERIETVFIYGVFICYILFLIKLLILSRMSHFGPSEPWTFNLIPFNTIKEYIFSNSANIKRFAYGNVVGNIAIFIPLGAYLSFFKNNKEGKTNLLFIFAVSLSVEIIQGILGIGASDIDDIILNCLGGWIGILGYKFLLFVFRDDKKVRTAIAILSAIGLPRLIFYLFIMRMKF